jgi:uncharacterized membrane protein YqhA
MRKTEALFESLMFRSRWFLAPFFFGLIVAILALVCHTIIKARTVSTLAEVEQVVHSLADHVKRGQAAESRTA